MIDAAIGWGMFKVRDELFYGGYKMSLDDFLKAAKAVDNDAIKPVKGTYSTVIKEVKVMPADEYRAVDYYRLNLQVAETLDGDKAPNRYFSKRYLKDEKGLQAFLNDMHTAGIEVPRDSVSTLEASFAGLEGKTVLIRTWAGTIKKDKDGADLPEDQWKEIQNFVVTSEKRNKKLVQKGSQVPF